MSHWWRAYDEALHDPKVIALNDRLHRAWFNLLCVASKNGGTLPAIATIAIELRVTVARAAEYLTALVLAGLIDEIELGKFAPHNWSARQFKSDVSTERVKRFRNGPRNVSSTVSETPPETDTERTDSETEKKDSEACASAPTQAELERELFRRGKQVCGKASGGLVQSLLKSKQFDVALARSVIEMAATKADPREFVAAATRVNSAPLPRPGSREDRQEKTANAYAKLREYARAGADVEGESFDVGDPSAGLLPFAKPS